MRFVRLCVFAPIVLAACVQPRAPAPMPRPAPPVARPAAPSPPPVDWADRIPAPGAWTYVRNSRGSIARFGVAVGNAAFTIRCEVADARIFVARAGTMAARITLRSTNGAKTYEAQPAGGTPLYVSAEIAARDPQLDSMAFSRGRILVGLAGASDLIMPIWPEFARVVEDCRG